VPVACRRAWRRLDCSRRPRCRDCRARARRGQRRGDHETPRLAS